MIIEDTRIDVYNLQDYTIEEMMDLVTAIKIEILNIEQNILIARDGEKENGTFDKAWYRRATYAKGIKKVQIVALNNELTKRYRERKLEREAASNP